MSPEQLEKRKIKEKKKKSQQIIKAQKALEKTKTKKNTVELGSKKRRKSDDKDNEVDFVSEGQNLEKKKKNKLGLEKKRRVEKGNEADSNNAGSIPKNDHAKRLSESGNSEKPKAASNGTKIKAKKLNKVSKHKKKDFHIAKERKIEQIVGEADEEKVEEIPLVDEDCSRGMKKWLIKYKEDRPGLKILQQRIDDFITAHEERQEQERKEREVQAAEGGWTVVTHHKGRKKTTDTETGVTVGSIALAAVVDNMGKKKSKEVPIDFYRFQKREAQRNEVMMLQSKFEQDKKRILQLRAARKFRPY